MEKKRVAKVDFNTGEVLQGYESIVDAAVKNELQYEVLYKALRKQNGIMRNKKLRFEFIE